MLCPNPGYGYRMVRLQGRCKIFKSVVDIEYSILPRDCVTWVPRRYDQRRVRRGLFFAFRYHTLLSTLETIDSPANRADAVLRSYGVSGCSKRIRMDLDSCLSRACWAGGPPQNDAQNLSKDGFAAHGPPSMDCRELGQYFTC